jgi:hypothetical protein
MTVDFVAGQTARNQDEWRYLDPLSRVLHPILADSLPSPPRTRGGEGSGGLSLDHISERYVGGRGSVQRVQLVFVGFS